MAVVRVRVMIRCRDIHGPCCDSCHDLADGGHEPLPTLTALSGEVEARVCCLKLMEAKARAGRPPWQRSGRLSKPSGECIR